MNQSRAQTFLSFASLLIVLVLFFQIISCRRSIVIRNDDDAMLARQVLIVALDAWKSKSADGLALREPPIRFADDDQAAGTELLEFEIAERKVDENVSTPIDVDLVLHLAPEQTQRKTVRYVIELEPYPRISRARQ